MLVASYEEDSGPVLAAIEPSGVCYVSTKTHKQSNASKHTQHAAGRALEAGRSRALLVSAVASSLLPLSSRFSVFLLSAQRYFGVAIGKAKQGSSAELEKLDFTKLTCREAVKHIARM